ncbi:Hpt domain-containing protein [Aquimarina agarilytica]|uniref:Hpt domain-containing protein n=1 Tax=Aquimarina agarilytica TaxID=1087449 RepID=UPI00028829B8|nr:Hpt domain-containing protein [Aquimarina agarilytica]
MHEVPNNTYIKQLANGNTAFEEKLIAIVKREFPEEQAEFIKNYKYKNYITAAENVHKLKNKIGMLGMEKGYQLAIDFENDLKVKKTILYPEFIVLLNQMEDFIMNL